MKTPDNWVILEISADQEPVFYKVLAGWYGGYLHGDSWALNSGIESVTIEDNYYDFKGYSGSVYRCGKDYEQLRMNIAGVLQTLKERFKDKIKVVPVEVYLDGAKTDSGSNQE